jgi:hypothetical protein
LIGNQYIKEYKKHVMLNLFQHPIVYSGPAFTRMHSHPASSPTYCFYGIYYANKIQVTTTTRSPLPTLPRGGNFLFWTGLETLQR